jgi:hypothetical protein
MNKHDLLQLRFGPDWEFARRVARQLSVAKTIGPFFTQEWVLAPLGGDALVTFFIDERVIALEFAQSAFIEFDADALPRLLRQELRSPENAWTLALARCGGDRRAAMAAILWTAHTSLLPEGLFDDSGEDFLWTLGMTHFA